MARHDAVGVDDSHVVATVAVEVSACNKAGLGADGVALVVGLEQRRGMRKGCARDQEQGGPAERGCEATLAEVVGRIVHAYLHPRQVPAQVWRCREV